MRKWLKLGEWIYKGQLEARGGDEWEAEERRAGEEEEEEEQGKDDAYV